MDAKREFVLLALKRGANVSELCRRFGVGRTAAYALLKRYREEADSAFSERSRRPKTSPGETSEAVVRAILELRDESNWGARKIRKVLNNRGVHVPERSTVHDILMRNKRIDPVESAKHVPWKRFEHPAPNDLAQIDFMGWFALGNGQQCHTLTMIDDHSRFALCVQACADERTETVQQHMTSTFRQYGLPWRMTMDNGSPWGDDGECRLTRLTAWLIRLGIGISHSRPYHPQTQGKDERLHKTLRHELVRWALFRNLDAAQEKFDWWRRRYNEERPHESLNMEPPISRYLPSTRSMPEKLQAIEYNSTDHVRSVDPCGKVSFQRHKVRVGRGCAGLRVAFRPTTDDGVFDVYFCHQRIGGVDLKQSTASARK